MNRKIHIYQSPLSEELIQMFDAFEEAIVLEHVQDDIITVADNDYYNEEPFDFEQFYELLSDDFDGTITMMIEPYTKEPFELENYIKEFLPALPMNLYTLEDIIIHAVIKNNQPLKRKFIEYFNECVNQDVIHTVRAFIDNNMNSSTTAKKLYMHRNTLNYRIDNFIEATAINVKTFKGANAVYMLYNYS